MQRRAISLIWICLCMFAAAGCSPSNSGLPTALPAAQGPLFCDIEEPRRFSQEELDWRAAHAPWNLRRDFNTNLAWDAECAPAEQQQDGK